MTVYIKLIIAGENTGPFNLYTNLDAFSAAFEIGIPRQTLIDGFLCSTVPDGTTQIKVLSTSEECDNYIILDIIPTGLTTTSTTTEPPITTTSTTTTIFGTTTTTTTVHGDYYKILACFTEFEEIMEKGFTGYHIGDWIRFRSIPDDGRSYCGTVLDDNWPTGPATVTISGPPPINCDDNCYGTH